MRNGHHNNFTNKNNQQQRNNRPRNNNNRSGGKGGNSLNRSYESNGPGVKIRGSASQIAEKYLTLARDAQSSSDYIAYEGFMQHAEHYIRLIAASHEQMRAANPNWRPEPLSFMNNNEDENDDEGEGEIEGQTPPQRQVYDEQSEQPDMGDVQPAQQQQRRPQHDRNQGERNNGERNNGERNNGERQHRPRYDAANNGEPREAREPRQPREPRVEGENGEQTQQPRGRFNRFDRNNRRPFPRDGEQAAPVGEDGGLTAAPQRGEEIGLPAFLTAPVVLAPVVHTLVEGEEPHIQRRRRPRAERVSEAAPVAVVGE